MGKFAAKQGDTIVSDKDLHLVVPPNGPPLLLKHDFKGTLSQKLSPNVKIMKKPAATVGSSTDNAPKHVVPTAPGRSFVKPPTNLGTIVKGSSTVFINGKAAARHDDVAQTCGDPDAPVGRVIASGSVFIG